MGTALTLALTTNVATAEVKEIELSPEGLEILCEASPLNSRCPGGTPLSPRAESDSLTEEETPTKPGATTPGSSTEPEIITPAPAPGTLNNSTEPETITPAPDTTIPGSSTEPETITPAPGTTIPDSSTEPETITPAPGTTIPDSSEPGMIAPDAGTPESPAEEENESETMTPAPGTEESPAEPGITPLPMN
ncbi:MULTISPECIES: hypothetical protein [unclassified Anabaena]|uniref:hypothetical protein n=1 Tax=unclassified Anabaena TaxID=2619674 RepID=UPI0039C6B4DA